MPRAGKASTNTDPELVRQHRQPRPRRHPHGRPGPRAALPDRGRARLRQDDAGHAVPAGGRAARRAGALHHAVGNRRGARGGRRVARLGHRPASPSASCCLKKTRSNADEQYTMFHPSEVELAATTKLILAGRRDAQADARRLRLAVGAAAAGRQPAALPPPDPGAQAVLRRPQLHGAAARRHDGRRSRPAGAEHRARRHPAGAAQPGVRRRAAAAARGQVSRQSSFAAAITTT